MKIISIPLFSVPIGYKDTNSFMLQVDTTELSYTWRKKPEGEIQESFLWQLALCMSTW